MPEVEAPARSIKDAIQAYESAGMPWDVPHIEIATWIVNKGLFEMPFTAVLKECDRLVADALRSECYTDAKGRKARAYGCAKGKWTDPQTGKERQVFLWNDMRTCDAEHAHKTARQMRESIGTDCRALSDSIASWNENNANLADNPIQLSFDFRNDVGRG